VKVMIIVGRLSRDVMDFCKKTCNVSFKWVFFSPLSDCSCNKPLFVTCYPNNLICFISTIFIFFNFEYQPILGTLNNNP
jgi:hypothetical protein